MRFATQLLARDAKKVHLFHEMYHAEQGYLAATNETIVMNIDYAAAAPRPGPRQVAERAGGRSGATPPEALPKPRQGRDAGS